ncbi:MAG: pyridoxal phosphate-dependent aminotransferase [bacterium]|nr:pyridoxal phosphate-dependent aminotransferase [bacterium]
MRKPDGSLISYFSNRVKKEGGINLAQGIPGFPPPSPLLSILKELSDDKTLHQYAPGNGNFQLLELIRERLSVDAPIANDNLLVLQGATEGVFLTFFYLTTILARPYSALSFDPVYESYPELAGMFNLPFLYEDFDKDLEVDFQKLERVVEEKKVKVIFIASPGNPQGKVWSENEMARLVELSRKYGFFIIYDAVYKDIYFKEPPFNPLRFNYERLFYVDSFSKMLSITGWRIGYIVTAAEHMKKIRSIHDYTGLSAVSVLQVAIARYLAANNYGKEYVESVKARCEKSYRFMKKELTGLGFRVGEIDGGYFMWAGLPEGWNDAFEFAVSLYDSVKVGVVPGENFSPSKRAYIRLNIAAEMPVIEEAVNRIKGFFKSK